MAGLIYGTTEERDRDMGLRDENMIEMVVLGRPQDQALPDGTSCSAGVETIIRVYESHEKAVMDLVEEATDKIEEAKQHFQNELEEHLETFVRDNDIRNATEADWERARATVSGSVEASFRTLAHRDMKPLVYARVTKRDLPPPERKKAVKENQELAKTLVEGQNEVLLKIAEMLAEREERMMVRVAETAKAAVEDMLGEKPKKAGR